MVMPAYNAQDYVSLAVASILGQSFIDLELIVVDDASTDSTAAIVSSFNDTRIQYVRTRGRTGASGARNLGLGLARGVYVAFLDADDLGYPGRLATQFAYMEARPRIGLVGAGYDVIDSRGGVLTTFTDPSGTSSIRLRMLFDNVLATSLAFARRDVLLEVGPFDEGYAVGEDHDMWARVASRHAVARLAEVLGAYRDHAAGTFRAGKAIADAMRAKAVGRVIESSLGVGISPGTAMVLGSASAPFRCNLEDAVAALALLQSLPRSPVWLWADNSTEQRAMTRVLIEKLVMVASREPKLQRKALWASARALRQVGVRSALDRTTLRLFAGLALAPGRQSRRASWAAAGDRPDSVAVRAPDGS